MSYDYDKIKERQEQEGGHQWTSYSDLFMVLTFLFLLLYVVASFRSGTQSLAAKLKLQQTEQEITFLKQQLQTYANVRDQYLKSTSSDQDKVVYQKVLTKLSLLSQNSKKKAQQLKAEKEKADSDLQQLNEYQRLIQDIVTANLNMQAKMKDRESNIQHQRSKIKTLVSKVENQESSLSKTKNKLTVASSKVDTLKKELVHRKEKSFKAFQNHVALENRMRQLLSKATQEKLKISDELEQTRLNLDATQLSLANKIEQNEALIAQSQDQESSFKRQISDLIANHKKDQNRLERAHKKKLVKAKLSTKEKMKAEKKFRKNLQKKTKTYKKVLRYLQGKLAKTETNIEDLNQEKVRLKQSNTRLSGELSENRKLAAALQKDLKIAEAKAKRRRAIGQQISKKFNRAGIKTMVNPKTGDLVLNFGSEYFDTGRFDLKPGMISILRKTIPLYAKSLLENKKNANDITSVEIVGFASPTYRNRVVDPKTLSPKDKKAVNYNLDLSYKRARSIFKYIFDTSKMSYRYQSELLPLVKVSGRSFFTEQIRAENPDNLNLSDFCEEYNCSKSQKVIIRFNLKAS